MMDDGDNEHTSTSIANSNFNTCLKLTKCETAFTCGNVTSKFEVMQGGGINKKKKTCVFSFALRRGPSNDLAVKG
jgi:hypothetical protein